MLLLPFIAFSALEYSLGQFGSTRSIDQLPCTRLARVCSPCSLFGIMAILTALPAQPLSAPHSIVLLAIIIRKYFPMILFLNPASIFLDFWRNCQTQTNAHFGRL
jgi:hypothetical protein